ncbi:MAG: methyltransferase domain-containing protein [Thermoplasmatota archaeon]
MTTDGTIQSDLAAWMGGRDPHARLRARAHVKLVAAVTARAPPPGFFLDAGGGRGSLARRGTRAGYVSLSLDLARGDVRGSFEALPFRDGSLRAVAMSASLHYAAKISETLREARRVLSPRGVLAVTLSPVHAGRDGAESAAATTRRRIARAGANGPLTRGYRHLVWDELQAALGAAGFTEAERLDGGLGRVFGAWRGVKRVITRVDYADFPLVLARAPSRA